MSLFTGLASAENLKVSNQHQHGIVLSVFFAMGVHEDNYRGHKVRGKELAIAVGITEQNLSFLRTGKVEGVRFATLERICEVLQCQPGDILEYSADDSDRND